MVADPDLDAGRDQLARDVCLDIGKTDHEIGFELEDFAGLRARERGNFGLFLARARRAHGETRDADDAVLLADGVEDFGRLLGQTDDTLRTHASRTEEE